MKKNYFGFLFLLMTAMSFAQNTGDFRSSGNGNWITNASWQTWDGSGWIAATSYPGELAPPPSPAVQIQAGHTITITTNLVTETIGDVTVNGTLSLNSNSITLNTPSLDINGGAAFLEFLGAQASLTLPAGASVIFQVGGDISGSCTPNNEIFIGTNQYAACRNPSAGSYTFGEVVAAGGTINANISIPATSINPVEVCTLINFTGGFTGTFGTNVTANWVLTPPIGPNQLIHTEILTSQTDTSSSSFTPNNTGTYVLTLEVTDGTLTSAANVVFNITPDETNPVITAPDDISIEACSADNTTVTAANAGFAYSETEVTLSAAGVTTFLALTNANIIEACGYTVTYQDSQTGNCPWEITRTYTITDDSNNTDSDTQTITVVDTTDPTLNVPANDTVECTESILPANTGTATGSDNCSSATITYSDSSTQSSDGSCTDYAYVITRTWTATDACGNNTSANQTITVVDTTDPTLNVPANDTVECTESILPANTGTATGSDNCSSATITYSDSSTQSSDGSCTDYAYVITRTWTATDACGNNTSANQTITVVDTTDPTLNVPANDTVECTESILPANTGTATGSDNCSSATITYSDSSTQSSDGSCTDYAYVITRTWTATDACGNNTSANQTITVVDTTDPTLNVPANDTVECTESILPANTGTATGSDNCSSATITYSDSSTQSSDGSCTDYAYVITRTWTATDACGNNTSANQTITVVDTTDPTLNVPANDTVECTESILPANTGTATGSDNCSSATITYSDSSTQSSDGSCTDYAYVITRTWTATDACGNNTSANQTITVVDTTDPTLNVPANDTVECTESILPANTGTATGSDNCSSATITYSDSSTQSSDGSCTDYAYVITRTWTATDACGNNTSANQTITVVDTTDPTLNVPANDTVECTESILPANTGTATGSDNCSSATITYSDSSTQSSDGSCTDYAYVITRTWTATDACGNNTSANQTITVVDTTDPTLNVPANDTVECTESILPANTGTATGSDNCSSATITYSDSSTQSSDGSCTDYAYVITRTWTATDACGNNTSANQTITVVDTTDPTLNVPANDTVECTESILPANTGTATGSDNCSSATITYSDSSTQSSDGSCTDYAYVITRTWTATDACGNNTSANQTITVVDTTDPTLNVPANDTVECTESILPANTGTATGSDNCSSATITYSDSSTQSSDGSCTDYAYVITRTWTATDACGNNTSANQTITVVDTTDPTLNVPANDTVECTESILPANTGTATGSDNCSSATITYSDSSTQSSDGSCTDYAYVITRTWTATDACGNNTSANQTITVVDTTDPTLNVPANDTVECTESILPANTGTATGSDNCSSATITYSDSSTQSSDGSCTDYAYVITRTWTATDACGNNTSANQTITVVDTTDPTLNVPANDTVECTESILPANTGTATGSDNCSSATITYSDSSTQSSDGSCTDYAYVITRTWTATDACGNNTSANQTITVVDTTDPTLNVPANDTVECTESILPANTGTATGSDNCSSATITYSDSSTQSSDGSCTDYAYVITRTWTATDACGNNTSANQTITVVDTTDPTLNVPANDTVECTESILPANTGTATGSDNCSSATITYSDSSTQSSDGSCTDYAYVITRTWTATDACGNNTSANQTITVVDTTDPTLNVPANDTVECTESILPANTGTATGSDNCSSATITYSDSSTQSSDGSCTDYAYVITRTWTATDACGNNTSANQTITVVDTTAPTVSAPTATALECADDLPDPATTISEFNALTGASASDNCTTNLTVSSTTSGLTGQTYNGTITRTYTITDACGNDTTVNHIFNINDTTPPNAVCTDFTLQLAADGTANISTLNINNGSNDNCGIASMTVSPSSFTCANVGANTVTLTVTDNNGNSSSCTAIVTVQDVTPPTVICQNIEVTIPFGETSVSITAADIDNGSTDACGIASYSLSQYTFTCGNIYGNTVTLTVTDIYGNSASCDANVIVNAPTLNTGSLIGEVVNPSPTPYVAPTNLIEVTSCPGGVAIAKDVALTFSGAAASDVDGWQVSIDNGVTWSPILNGTQNQLTHTLTGLLSTTLVRVVVNTGSCAQFSPVATIRFLPPDLPPIIVDSTTPFICLGDDVTITAESYYETYGQFGDSGDFNHAQPEDWRVDRLDGFFPASGNNTSELTWKEVAQEKLLSNIRHFPYEGSKFAGVHGEIYSTMETPVINLVGITPADAVLEFYTAYYFCPGAVGYLKLSFDSGVTYNTILDTYTGDTGIVMDGNGCNTNDNGNHPTNDGYELMSIDLSAYAGLSGLRIMFEYSALNTGSCSDTFTDTNGCGNNNRTVLSSWAVDGVRLPFADIDEVIVWEDEFGNEVTTGSTVIITPVTPGIQTYGSTVEVNQCRQDGDDGTQFVTIEASLAYAGEDFTPTTAQCGQSSLTLNAYDNTRSAFENSLDVDEHGNAAYPRLGSGDVVPTQHYSANAGVGSPDYPGTGMTGAWTVSPNTSSCGVVPVFSSNTNPKATFTAGPGTYTLTWTLTNGCSDSKVVTINNCDEINFDGIDDYVTFKNNYNLNGPFSIEAWIKPNATSGTIFSRKDNAINNAGYDLSLSGGSLVFDFGSGSISTGNIINTSRWFHVAVTFDGSNYLLYVDGVPIGNPVGGSAPVTTPNNIEAILGAIDQSPPGQPVNYYTGWIDEFRVWNRALNQQHIRQMMNQEIKDLGGNVGGEVIPTKIYGVDTNQDGTEEDLLTWTHLDGYYRMAVDCGYLTAYKGVSGRIRNITSPQTENAPIPYTTKQGGDWDNINTWSQPSVWYIPNSTQHGTQIDWNIVRTSNNVIADHQDITVLGLLVDSGELTTTNSGTQNENNTGHGLWVTDYLLLNGQIDLIGESQLVQKRYHTTGNPTIQFNESILDVTSGGYLERDQQGTTNLFNYNYWGSPVGPINTSANNLDYDVDGCLRDGTTSANPQNLGWTSSYDATGSVPVTLSNRWIYAYENNAQNTYFEWQYKGENGAIAAGLSYTMKGSAVGNPVNDVQNYTFHGKPNNGTISNPIGINNDALLGNPYASAIDANEFIRDNVIGGTGSQSITGTLYFWIHYTSNFTHILELYEGGYAQLNLSGGNPAITPPVTVDGIVISGAGSSPLIPQRYIPVGQGFFVNADSNGGGTVSFQNDQRIFMREANNSSIFMQPNDDNMNLDRTIQNSSNNNSNDDYDDVIKRLRLDFTPPEQSVRPLLLAFTPNNEATDGFDYGYDAENYDGISHSDMSWLIDDKKYVIQGVGNFDSSKKYPLGIQVATAGEIKISLKELENFDSDIPVYIYDSLLETYTQFNDSPFTLTLDANDYMDRFYLTFENEESLNIEDNTIDSMRIYYLNDTKEIYINWVNSYDIKEVQLINVIGQTVRTWDKINPINSHEIRIPVKNISEGNYIIKVINNHGMRTNKKIILKQ